MELTDPAILEELISPPKSRRPAGPRMARPRAESPSAQPLAIRIGPARCDCGTCKRCIENARWERIFNEKFADPDYYSSNMVRYTSPLK